MLETMAVGLPSGKPTYVKKICYLWENSYGKTYILTNIYLTYGKIPFGKIEIAKFQV